jgi:hypothetical protein
MKSVWQWITRLSALLGIIGFGLSLYALFRIDRLADLVAKASHWSTLAITLDRPSDSLVQPGHLLDMAGAVRFEQGSRPPASSLRLQLLANQIQLVPMVRPRSEPLRWWPQDEPAVGDDGHFSGTVRVGRPEPASDSGTYEVVLLAVPRNSIVPTETYAFLPPHYAESRVARIRRRH